MSRLSFNLSGNNKFFLKGLIVVGLADSQLRIKSYGSCCITYVFSLLCHLDTGFSKVTFNHPDHFMLRVNVCNKSWSS